MNIVFLDIDGVLNKLGEAKIVSEMVSRLNRLCIEGNAHLILSSAWRLMIWEGSMTLVGFHDMLKTHGLNPEIKLIGYTPVDEEIHQRKDQIKTCFSPFKIENHVILDDNLRHDPEDGLNVIRTNSWVGLTDEDVGKALRFLGGRKD